MVCNKQQTAYKDTRKLKEINWKLESDGGQIRSEVKQIKGQRNLLTQNFFLCFNQNLHIVVFKPGQPHRFLASFAFEIGLRTLTEKSLLWRKGE